MSKDSSLWSLTPLSRNAFREKVYREGKKHYRELPWRNIDDPYAVLVSEVMLQQTQVSRVLSYWGRWMTMFPNVDVLAQADTSLVLEQWMGLGYNRRALALKRASEQCSLRYNGTLPHTYDELLELPGVGPATAAGICAFAYQQPGVYLETNVRSVFLHELFPNCDRVSDRDLIPYVKDACLADDVRAWYYALLDYGAVLKKMIQNPARRSAHYARQSTFKGSRREKRSAFLKHVLASEEGVSQDELIQLALQIDERNNATSSDVSMLEDIIDELVQEGFIELREERYYPPSR